MKAPLFVKVLLPLFVLAVFGLATGQEESKPGPLKVLLIAGGCCHDYAAQHLVLEAGIEERLNAEVTAIFNPDKSTEARFEIYESENWADGYDVVIHDECTAKVTDKDYVNRILNAHKEGTPVVNLHCAMHSYRWGDFKNPVAEGADNAGWYEMIGLQSSGHGPQSPIDVTFSETPHPITMGLENWTTINEELYNNVQIYDGTQVLANGFQLQMPRVKKGQKPDPNAKPKEANAAVAWVNEYGPNKTRIVSTSLGHNTETVADDRYLAFVARGILWATGNLDDEGQPAAGYVK
ncbi:MAG: ThuA domain-containing protein [Verrucomicrobiota bacterium]